MDKPLSDEHGPNQQNGSIPPTPNSELPPQLSATVPGHGCPCEGCQNIGDGDKRGCNGLTGLRVIRSTSDNGRLSDDERSVNGDEGPDERRIDVGDLGKMPLRALQSCIERHRRCVCRLGCLCDVIDLKSHSDFRLTVTSPELDILRSRGSVAMNVGDPVSSSTASEVSFSTRSTSSSCLVAHVTGGFGEGETLHSAYGPNFIHHPIWLGPGLQLGTMYPLRIHEADFEDDST